MSKKPEPWHLWVLAIYTVIVLWYLAWTGIDGAKDWCVVVPSVSEDDCASWVQAIGSIAAIAAGGVAVWWQMRQQRLETASRDRDGKIQHLQVLLIACRRILEELDEYIHGFDEDMALAWLIPRARLAVKALQDIPLLEMPMPEVAEACFVAVASFQDFDKELESCTSLAALAGNADVQGRLALLYFTLFETAVLQALDGLHFVLPEADRAKLQARYE